MEAKKYPALIIKRITAVAAIIYLLITYNLYLNEWLIPFVPAVDELLLPALIHYILYVGMLICLIFIVYKPLRWEGVVIYCLLFLIAFILNINRFAPYYQHFIFFLLIPTRSSKRDIVYYISFFLGVTYLFSGLHKLTKEYEELVVPSLVNSLSDAIPLFIYKSFIPWYEITLGLLLITSLLNSYRFFFAMAMHLVIISTLLFLQWNLDVIPWNIYCIVLLFYAGYAKDSGDSPDYLIAKLTILATYALIVIASYYEYINIYFSFPLYSGNTFYGMIMIEESVVENLPEDFKSSIRYLKQDDSDQPYIDVDVYALHTNKSKLFPSQIVYKSVGDNFSKYDKTKALLLLRINANNIIGKGVLPYIINETK